MNSDEFISVEIPSIIVESFGIISKQKIKHEHWTGRNINTKENNFIMCWLSEHAFKEVLGDKNIKYSYSGLYVGPVELSNKEDFTVWINSKIITLGLRSRTLKQLDFYKEIPYPDDRLRLEKEIISDYLIASSIEYNIDGGATVKFYGMVLKKDFFKYHSFSKRKFSIKNQEHFRLFPLSIFKYNTMIKILNQLDKV